MKEEFVNFGWDSVIKTNFQPQISLHIENTELIDDVELNDIVNVKYSKQNRNESDLAFMSADGMNPIRPSI